MIIPIERLQLLDKVKYMPGKKGYHIDTVIKLHYRPETFFGNIVTVTHETGCWSKELGQMVEVIKREGSW